MLAFIPAFDIVWGKASSKHLPLFAAWAASLANQSHR